MIPEGVRRFVLAVLLAGCSDPAELTTTVVTMTGEPIADAIVSWVCTPDGDAGAASDATGIARPVVYHSSPELCTVTVTAPGFRTAQVESAPAPITVTLEAVP